MEQQLFTWEDWELLGTTTLAFSNIVLIKAIKDYPIGKQFKSAIIDYELGKLQLYSTIENFKEFDLELKVI